MRHRDENGKRVDPLGISGAWASLNQNWEVFNNEHSYDTATATMLIWDEPDDLVDHVAKRILKCWKPDGGEKSKRLKHAYCEVDVRIGDGSVVCEGIVNRDGTHTLTLIAIVTPLPEPKPIVVEELKLIPDDDDTWTYLPTENCKPGALLA